MKGFGTDLRTLRQLLRETADTLQQELLAPDLQDRLRGVVKEIDETLGDSDEVKE